MEIKAKIVSYKTNLPFSKYHYKYMLLKSTQPKAIVSLKSPEPNQTEGINRIVNANVLYQTLGIIYKRFYIMTKHLCKKSTQKI